MKVVVAVGLMSLVAACGVVKPGVAPVCSPAVLLGCNNADKNWEPVKAVEKEPEKPAEPVKPSEPVKSTDPVKPADPVKPEPEKPSKPDRPGHGHGDKNHDHDGPREEHRSGRDHQGSPDGGHQKGGRD